MDIISFNEASTANSRIEKIIANPDSTSGIVTVPKTIASGETVTIPAGRVAVLPNLQIDGTLDIQGDVFIPSGSTFDDLDSRIEVINTNISLKAPLANAELTGIPKAPTASVGTNTTQLATTAFVLANLNGVIASSKTTNGYIKFSNGLIIQWGQVNSSSNTTVTFPIAFPTAIVSANAVDFNYTIAGVYSYMINSASTTSMTIGRTGSTMGNRAWIAIGY